MESTAQRRARERYESRPDIKGRRAGVYMKLNRDNDADILEHLEKIENVQGYIKELIRADMARGK